MVHATRSYKTVGTLGLLLLSQACRGPASDGISTVRDSAGITIVTTPDVVTREPWSVGTEPLLMIGDEESEKYRFSNISGVLRLPDGRIVVADQSPSVRMFSERGEYLRNLGREGQGPGEFRSISLLSRKGDDTVLVWDAQLRRLTFFSHESEGHRTIMGPSLPGFFVAADILPDGSLLGFHVPGLDLSTIPIGTLHADLSILRYHSDAMSLDTLGTVLGGDAYVGPGPRVTSIPFSPNPVMTGAGDNVYVGSGASYEIRRYSLDGQLRRIQRLQRANAPLTDHMRDEYIRRVLQRAANSAARLALEKEHAELPYPKTLPAYQAMLVDAASNLWVRAYVVDREEPGKWTVFDSAGLMINEMITPPGFNPFEIGPDYLLGVSTDSIGIERIANLSLLK